MNSYLHQTNKHKEDGSNIIKRREIDPLLTKAVGVLASYRKASPCMVSVLDKSGQTVETLDYKNALSFCTLCKKYNGKAECPCSDLHIDSMNKAQSAGGAYIYMCDAGFVYWISIIYAGARQIGALSAGKVLYERQSAVKKLISMTNGAISESEAFKHLQDIPERSYEEIKALAQMLEFCAEDLSAGAEDYVKESTLNKAKEKSQVPYEFYPLDKERLFLAALRRGDTDTAKMILRKFLNNIITMSPDSFEFIQLRAIELVVILSREAWNMDTENTEYRMSLETNNRYIKKIQEAKNIAELNAMLCNIIDQTGGKIFSFHGVRHASALRKAERFIWENYTRKLSLQEIADISGLSASYFSSIFKEEMGENLSSYLNRLRAEKAAVMLTETDLSLNEIALACGFEDQSWFSKIFKTFAGVSPGKYREEGCGTLARIGAEKVL